MRVIPSSLNRYGGEKISAFGWFVVQVPQRPPPPVKTVASGNKMPIEWYVLGMVFGVNFVKRVVVGSQSSGVRMAVSSEKGTALDCPPTMKMLPSGRTTAL